jgi:hypothetical protein
MIGQPKPLASLSSGLLARKGQAKPAMRPQGFGGFGMMGNAHEDLGWNDMGHDYAPDEPDFAPTSTSLSALTPAGHDYRAESAIEEDDEEEAEDAAAIEDAMPPVLRQREALREEFAPAPAPAVEIEAEAEAEPELAPAPKPALSPARVARIGRAAVPAGRKAAFTLRLDNDRHLKLRLASAVTGHSSQQLVTIALDAFLETLPEVADLADQVPAQRGKKLG